jgi:hypothetical protein
MYVQLNFVFMMAAFSLSHQFQVNGFVRQTEFRRSLEFATLTPARVSWHQALALSIGIKYWH